MAYPFLPVNPCCTDVVLNSPCGCTSTLPNTGCGQDQCGTNVILSSNVLYNGPVLDCIIAEPCDTLNVILQKIDEIICNLLTQINILNIQVTNITTQIININTSIVNINNTLAECCTGATTTTTSTTICPCTYHEYVSIFEFPGTFTYVECDTFEVLTVTGSLDVNVVCVNNNYPTIEIGKINVLNTGECCSVITTTTTTTAAPIQSFCNEVTVIGTVYLYWTTGGGEPQVLKIDDETVYICAQVGSIAISGTGAVTILGSAITCESDGECAPTTTTTSTIPPTTTTTTTLPCTSYNLEATGTNPRETVWEAVECNTFITVGGTIIFPNILNTGCVIDGSLLLGAEVIIVDSEPCPTTTTTTTVVSCIEIIINAAGDCPDFPGFSVLEYTDCNGVYQTVQVNSGELPTFCSLVGGIPPAFICGTGDITYGSTCISPTTTTTSSSSTSTTSTSTTSTTTTIAPCVEWSWEAIGANSSNLEYTDCDGLPVVIPIIDVTNNSGIICVYPSVTPNWNPLPTTGIHTIGTVGADCSTTTTTSSSSSTTTTTTTCPCKSFDIIIDEADLIASSKGVVDVGFTDCSDQPQIYSYDTAGTYTNAFCAVLFPKEPLASYLIGTTVVITVDQPTIAGCCTGGCVQYTVITIPGDTSWTALDCDGVEVSGSILYPNIETLDCLQQGTLDVTNGTVESEEPCPTTTTTTTAEPTTTTTSSSSTSTSTTTSSSSTTTTTTTVVE